MEIVLIQIIKINNKSLINKDKNSLKDLSSKISKEFHKGTQVFPSNIIAFPLKNKKFKNLIFFTQDFPKIYFWFRKIQNIIWKDIKWIIVKL